MKSTPILAVGLAALLSAPAFAQSESGTPAKSNASKSPSSDQIRVLSARDMIDESVMDKQGNELGEVEYLMISAMDGSVRYVIVDPEDDNDEIGDKDMYVPVPWRAIGASGQNQQAGLTVAQEQFAKQKRYSEEQLAELTQPAVATSVIQLWAPVSSGQDGSGQQQQNKSANKQNQSAGQGGDGQGEPHFLVDSEVVTTVVPPAFVTSSDIRGSQVNSSDGDEYGEIENLIIDRDRGRIAFAQVEHGGFLGLGGEITPVPFEALSYDHQNNVYQLNKSTSDLEKIESFRAGDQPSTIKTDELTTLYETFGVKTYW